MSELDLDRLEALAEGATTGPWEAWDRGIGYEVHHDGEPVNNEFREVFRPADAEFIAAAREAVPALIAEVRLQRENVTELDRQLDVDTKHAAIEAAGEWCPICTHFEIDDLITALDGERDRADALAAKVAAAKVIAERLEEFALTTIRVEDIGLYESLAGTIRKALEVEP